MKDEKTLCTARQKQEVSATDGGFFSCCSFVFFTKKCLFLCSKRSCCLFYHVLNIVKIQIHFFAQWPWIMSNSTCITWLSSALTLLCRCCLVVAFFHFFLQYCSVSAVGGSILIFFPFDSLEALRFGQSVVKHFSAAQTAAESYIHAALSRRLCSNFSCSSVATQISLTVFRFYVQKHTAI